MVESKVGSKGELFLPKKIRQELDLKAGDKVFFEVLNGILTVIKVPDLLELLQEPPIGEAETPDEIERDLEKIQKQQFTESRADLP